MIAFVNFNQWPIVPNREIQLIKLVRELQSTSREIDDEEPIDRNHLRDDSNAEHS